MGNIATLLFGGKTKEQKALEREQQKTAADALAKKVTALQDDVGTRTRELVQRYGVASGGGGGSPSSAVASAVAQSGRLGFLGRRSL